YTTLFRSAGSSNHDANPQGTMYRSIVGIVTLILTLSASDASGQDRRPCPVAEAGTLVLYGDIGSPIVLTEADLLALPQTSVRGTPHGGEPSDYAGPRLEDVLAPANLPRGPQLRGAEGPATSSWRPWMDTERSSRSLNSTARFAPKSRFWRSDGTALRSRRRQATFRSSFPGRCATPAGSAMSRVCG